MSFHVNITTGVVNPCHATIKECPYGGNEVHGSTAEEAAKIYEQAKIASLIPPLLKKRGRPTEWAKLPAEADEVYIERTWAEARTNQQLTPLTYSETGSITLPGEGDDSGLYRNYVFLDHKGGSVAVTTHFRIAAMGANRLVPIAKARIFFYSHQMPEGGHFSSRDSANDFTMDLLPLESSAPLPPKGHFTDEAECLDYAARFSEDSHLRIAELAVTSRSRFSPVRAPKVEFNPSMISSF